MKRPSRTKAPGTTKPTTNSLSDLLHTNLAPTPADILMVEKAMQVISDKVLKLESKIEDLRAKLELHYVVFAPIRRVPMDVLQEIMFFVPDGELDTTKLVCRVWYEASAFRRSTGVSNLDVSFELHAGIPSQRIRSWLDNTRLGRKALDIRQLDSYIKKCPCLNASMNCAWADPGFIDLFKKGALPEDLSVAFEPSSLSCYLRFMAALKHRPTESKGSGVSPGWNSLTSLKIDFRSSVWNGEVGTYQELLKGLPSTLLSLAIQFEDLRRGQVAPVIDASTKAKGLRSLTSLSLECPWDTPFALALLRQCINLKSLSLHVNGRSHGAYTWTEPGTKITFPSLHTLSLTTRTPKRCSQLLSNNLHFPSLQHLAVAEERVERFGGQDITVHEILHSLRLLPTRDSMGKRQPPASRARLRTLTVKEMECSPAIMHEIFGGGLQYLEELVLDGVAMHTGELSRMLWVKKPEPIDDARQVSVPRLKVLKVRSVRSVHLAVEGLLQYLCVRHNRNKRFAVTASSSTGPQLSIPQAITPWHIIVQYECFNPDNAFSWQGCVGVVEKLKTDCGALVERMMDEDEMMDYLSMGLDAATAWYSPSFEE